MHFESSSISYNNIYIPKLLKALWVSKGWLFMKEYKLHNNEFVGRFIYWYLISRKIEIRNEEIENKLYFCMMNRFHNYSSIGPNQFSLTPIQKIILNSRPDLKFEGEYPEIDFQKWWIAYGAKEYDLKRFPMDHKQIYRNFSEEYIKELYIDIFGNKEDYYRKINVKDFQKILKKIIDDELKGMKL